MTTGQVNRVTPRELEKRSREQLRFAKFDGLDADPLLALAPPENLPSMHNSTFLFVDNFGDDVTVLRGDHVVLNVVTRNFGKLTPSQYATLTAPTREWVWIINGARTRVSPAVVLDTEGGVTTLFDVTKCQVLEFSSKDGMPVGNFEWKDEPPTMLAFSDEKAHSIFRESLTVTYQDQITRLIGKTRRDIGEAPIRERHQVVEDDFSKMIALVSEWRDKTMLDFRGKRE